MRRLYVSTVPQTFFLNFSLSTFIHIVSKNMLCRGRSSTRIKKNGSVPVYLNVYDLTSLNGCAYWFGLGVYHSGVQGVLTFYPVFLRFTVQLFSPGECKYL
ncbi:PPPDE putative peptidase domain-containing protein [Artemisia annua]|uniref:PPPDE putative peptidase domain-containing protein n=1 Tax=Artemisia annua TaxID=35608 RepID=A0A2U1M164_ARTAN|nr:PPPDE putative peptidase domain-containing protein [Artemisia annua]